MLRRGMHRLKAVGEKSQRISDGGDERKRER